MPFTKDWKKKAKEAKEAELKAKENKTEESLPVQSPIHKAFYIEKDKGVWKLVIADLQDDKVIAKKVRDCENKALSLEAFKIAFAELYYFGK